MYGCCALWRRKATTFDTSKTQRKELWHSAVDMRHPTPNACFWRLMLVPVVGCMFHVMNVRVVAKMFCSNATKVVQSLLFCCFNAIFQFVTKLFNS